MVVAVNLLVEHVDVVVERGRLGEGGALGELHRLIHLSHGVAVDLLALLGGERAFALQQGAERGDGVALAPPRDLLLGAVVLGVGHRMAAEAVGDGLHKQRAALLAHAAQRLGDDGVGVEDVHAVAAHAGHAERLALALKVGHGGVARERGAHAELVVDHHEHHRQAPQRGEVERLAERALVGGAVAERAERDLVGPRAESQASAMPAAMGRLPPTIA